MLYALLLLAGAAADPPCRAFLVPCNLGASYSGTLHFASVLQSSAGKSTYDVTARVDRGKVVCEGSTDQGPILGEGLLVVESGIGTDDDDAQPWYRIAVACPEPDGSPARMNGSEMQTYKQPLKGLEVLKGAVEEDHPDADAVNGVTGTVRLTWSFSRPAP